MAMKAIPSGELVELLATDPGSPPDVVAWARTTGNELVEQSVEEGVYRFVLRRK
jgi:tRNA 2-thiouridine synthesizing protein A